MPNFTKGNWEFWKHSGYPYFYIGKIGSSQFLATVGKQADARLIDAHNLNFNLGNVIKYVTRAGRKDGEDTLTALKKALWYLNREIQNLEV